MYRSNAILVLVHHPENKGLALRWWPAMLEALSLNSAIISKQKGGPQNLITRLSLRSGRVVFERDWRFSREFWRRQVKGLS